MVDVQDAAWLALRGRQEVDIVFVPGRPELNRLAAGMLPRDLAPSEDPWIPAISIPLLAAGGACFAISMRRRTQRSWPASSPGPPSIHERPSTWSGGPGPWLIVAVGAAAVLPAWVALDLREILGTTTWIALMTIPILVSIFALRMARGTTRLARRVVAAEDGIDVESPAGTRRIAWSGVAQVQVELALPPHHRMLVLRGADGRVLMRLPGTLSRFDDLADLAARHGQEIFRS